MNPTDQTRPAPPRERARLAPVRRVPMIAHCRTSKSQTGTVRYRPPRSRSCSMTAARHRWQTAMCASLDPGEVADLLADFDSADAFDSTTRAARSVLEDSRSNRPVTVSTYRARHDGHGARSTPSASSAHSSSTRRSQPESPTRIASSPSLSSPTGRSLPTRSSLSRTATGATLDSLVAAAAPNDGIDTIVREDDDLF